MSIHISCDMYLRLGLHVQIGYIMYCHIKRKFGQAQERFYIGSMYCVLRTKHAKCAKETFANFLKYSTLKSAHFFLEPSIHINLFNLLK